MGLIVHALTERGQESIRRTADTPPTCGLCTEQLKTPKGSFAVVSRVRFRSIYAVFLKGVVMSKRSRTVLAAMSLLAAVLGVSRARADAPWTTPPYDDTRFAPITRTGPSIGLVTVATGLVAPNKGVVAPGLERFLFVVDQPGQVWAIDLSAPQPVTCPGNGCTLFLDV